MSYARFGGDSDVYVYLDVGGYLCCCGCILGKKWDFHTTEEMLIHLGEHRQAGHQVPQYCIDGLKEEQEENDEWIRLYKPELDSELRHAYNNRVAFSKDVEGRFVQELGYKAYGTPLQEVSYNRELSERKHIGDRIGRQFAGENVITFDSMTTYFIGYIKVVDRIKAAIEAGNKHYGTNDTYTSPWRNSMHQPGERVGVLISATDKEVRWLGFGTYDGNFAPDNVNVDQIYEEVKEIFPDKDSEEVKKTILESPLTRNPRITLDTGEIVWGYECWWGEASKFSEEWFDGRDIVQVTVDELRGHQTEKE